MRLVMARDPARPTPRERNDVVTSLFMDPLGPDVLIRSFERHLDADNRSARTVATYTRSSRSFTAGFAERRIRTLKDRNLSFLHSTATAA
jgi:hypothetical protein